MGKLSRKLAETIEDLLGTGDVSPERLVAAMWERHEGLLRAESKRLIDAQIWKAGKDLCRSDDEQEELPGVTIPRVVNIVTADGSRLKLASRATLDELERVEFTRETNATRAAIQLKRLREGIAMVRPVMLGHPEMTLGEAMQKLGINADPEEVGTTETVEVEVTR